MSDTGTEKIPLTPMSRKQRRVLGVLLEKAFTTPEQYPLTLKATTTGCNQKNNRDPVSSYDEDTVHQTLEELRERGFVGCLHTESGRTERYRHYLRHRTDLTEPHLAIITELLLRGPQQLGELRTRASRMVAIESQDDLRDALQTLAEKNLVRANGPLERRGIEVDHNLYPPGENHEPLAAYEDIAEPPADVELRPVRSIPASRPESVPRDDARIAALEGTIHDLQSQLSDIRELLTTLKDDFAELRRQIGG